MNLNYEFSGSFVFSSLLFLLSQAGSDVCFENGATMFLNQKGVAVYIQKVTLLAKFVGQALLAK